MSVAPLRQCLIEKINTLTEEQISSVISFVESLQNPLLNNQEIDKDRQQLAEQFRQLCSETQALFIDNPMTEKEIESEIKAYRRGE
jgi:hypothetical protein